MSTDPKMQAFVEDLAAVCVKHGLILDNPTGSTWVRTPNGSDEASVCYIDHNSDLYFGRRVMDDEDLAYVVIPYTAHGRLAAAARVASFSAIGDGWNTDGGKLAWAAVQFEVALPGWWWSVGMCSVGAHASCAVDGNGPAGHMLDGVKGGHPFDVGFHCDTRGGLPHEALENVMQQALEYLKGATQ